MKKKGKNKKEKKKKNFLSEFEITTYEQQLIDDNRQLARLRTHNEMLERKAGDLQNKLKELEENKSDLTSHLQHILQKKTAEAQELHERLLALEKLYDQEQLAFKKKEESLENDFRTMEHNLTGEIKLAAGKLNSLEEYRLNRLELMKKFEEQEKIIADQETRHKQILYEAEKKFIIGKARMQNELENRLSELSKSFREATSLRLADATQQAVQENIALRKELNRLVSQCRDLDSDVMDYKERERTWRLQASLHEAEAHLALKKVMKQTETIQHLATEHQRMGKEIGWAKRGERYALLSEQILEEVRKNYEEMMSKTRLLEQNVEVARVDTEGTMTDVLNNCQEIQKLEEILRRAKETIRNAQVQIKLLGKEDACYMCLFDVKEKLFQSLFEIFESYQEASDENEKETESEPIGNIYEFGNLGLIPTSSAANVAQTDKSDSTNSAKNSKDSSKEEKKERSDSSSTDCPC